MTAQRLEPSMSTIGRASHSSRSIQRSGHGMARLVSRVVVGMSLATIVGVAAPAAGSGAAAPAPDSGGLRVVHGLPGVTADVYLDNEVVIRSFAPQRSTDVLAVAAGAHTIDIRTAGAPATDEPVLTGTAFVVAGQNMSEVVHLSATGLPALTSFVDDDSPVPPGLTRVIVRHTAAAPPIDVKISDSPIAIGLANPGEVGSQVAAGTYEVAVTAAGSSQALAPTSDVPFAEGSANDMYFIGDQAAGTLGWIAVQTAGLQSAPTKIQTGDSGLAATNSSSSKSPVLPMLALLAAGTLVLGAAVERRRLQVA